ncbi:MAG: adenylate/guanylate cyclase domain-containing protein [Spirochaetales bacterium]|nr:adenylate/guanylate cyclase domain-containing protein [Spirochaetales bacterium]MCF7937356.1 adenylate/guanylate cyclase domain-containing protein [Spirochaetales bacterium]
MGNSGDNLFGKKVGKTRVVPLVLKIIVIFVIFLLVSNFATNYVTLVLARGELVKLMNKILVKDLKELYVYCSNQHQIYEYNPDLEGAQESISEAAGRELPRSFSLALGVKPEGGLFFHAANGKWFREAGVNRFSDTDALEQMKESRREGSTEGTVNFTLAGHKFFGMYKYQPQWEMYLIRAEETEEFNAESWAIFRQTTYIIIGIALFGAVVGIFLIRYILRFLKTMTNGIMQMMDSQRLDLLDLEGAPNDDVTYLGASFNALSSTIDNLLSIFKKFVAQDVARKAYEEREVRLEGQQEELTIFFSDIKGFTYMTETLGTDIIKLLNLHYDKAIYHIHKHGGVIGSIIGDALLAVYGVSGAALEGNKSVHAIESAYLVHQVASELRQEMSIRREEIIEKRGSLTEEEERIYQAVLIDVGVGIDGGTVFYGNIGSDLRMTNTVIGDNVNSASRLEGLTRVYKVPVVCSDYIKEDVERDTDDFYFLEIDMVQVKGKTEGMKVYWPIPVERLDDDFKADVERFSRGLRAYYEGDWKQAYADFSAVNLAVAEIFAERTQPQKAPDDWNGIWTMKTK